MNGSIRAREVKVEASPWPDFVFEGNYKFPTLFEVESFIKENQHLPGIPSANEVAEQGVALGKMSANLLQKIEELTLYAISQEKRLKSQKEDNEIQNAKTQELEQEVEKLKALVEKLLDNKSKR